MTQDVERKRLVRLVLAQLASGEIKLAAAVSILNYSERNVNRLMHANGLQRPEQLTRGAVMQHRRKRTVEVAEQRTTCLYYAEKVIRNQMMVGNAARLANCSIRTMYRWMALFKERKKAEKASKKLENEQN